MICAESTWSEALPQAWEFFATGGWFMVPLVLCSMVVITVSIFKFLDLAKSAVLPKGLVDALGKFGTPARDGDIDPMRKELCADSSPLGRICNSILANGHARKEAAASAAEAAGREETSKLERGVGWLEVTFTIAPMLGLIGTAFGLVRIFRNLGIQGADAEKSAAIARGIAEAMNSTIFGLAVAVIAYVAWNFFTRRVETLALRMQSLATDFLNTLYAPLPALKDEAAPTPHAAAKSATLPAIPPNKKTSSSSDPAVA